MRKINLYKYEELPTEKAKEKARSWWIDRELKYPAWEEEHWESMYKIVERVKQIETKDDFEKLKKDSEENQLTGYCADYLYFLMCKDRTKTPTIEEVKQFYTIEWQNELEQRTTDINYIEEDIETNEYEFLEDGSFYGGSQ